MPYSTLDRFHPPYVQFVHTVTVDAAGGADYTTIKAAVLAAVPTYTRRWRVYVRNGTYNEIQILGKRWVDVEGESLADVVMISDGLRTDIDPISGLAYNVMLESAKSGWFITKDMTLSNMTISVNDVKYCIHSDAGGAYTFYLENAHLIHESGNPFGIGLNAAQNIVVTDCSLEITETPASNDYGVFCHNWNDQAGNCSLTLTRVVSIGCGLLLLTELGSEHADVATLTDCSSPQNPGFEFTVSDNYWNGGGQGAVNVPYSWNIALNNCVGLAPITYNATTRPNLLDYVDITP